ncbi:hypothetical protein CCR75_006519 [Bremia lactucae]|uniref:Methyltransferase-like protein 4 n=1 Tax=Bremia lactucae TaxID=4779 RepID=A0A976IG02_BRELC|nr:hypothetical protein CCR75_006519 [Bremia lactucae]
MELNVSCVNHAALVNSYYLRILFLRVSSFRLPLKALSKSSAAAVRRQRKTVARRRAEQLKELIAQGKFVPLSFKVRTALRNAYDRFSGERFESENFLPSYQDGCCGTDALQDVLNTLREFPRAENLNDGNVHRNLMNCLQVAEVNGNKYILPAGSVFARRDVRAIHEVALGKHKLIVIDPPWHNKSVSRGNQYVTFDHTDLLRINVPHIADLDECILAVWVTNRPRYKAYLQEKVLPSWGFTFHAYWYWLKLSKSGELLSPLDSTHRLPVETLVVAYRSRNEEIGQRLRQQLGEQMRIVLSVPLRHSWKPPMNCFFDESIGSQIELFARELRPYWTSVGYEVLKFQDVDLFQSATSVRRACTSMRLPALLLFQRFGFYCSRKERREFDTLVSAKNMNEINTI